MDKTTFVIMYQNMLIGGIEQWLIRQIEIAKEQHMRIIWLNVGKGKIFDGWSDLIRTSVEIVPIKMGGRGLCNFPEGLFSENERVTSVCFGLIEYACLHKMKSVFPNLEIDCFNIIPHFCMPIYYPEEYFKTAYAKHIKSKAAEIYKEGLDRNEILFFSQRHFDEIRNRYGLSLPDSEKYRLPPTEETRPFLETLAEKRAKRDPFKIISCGRIDFPHKGYMMGLVDAYGELKKKYPDILLDFIGYGPSENELRCKIQKLPPDIAADIRILGAIAPDKLDDYFDSAHVNISVAGGVSAGAKSGLVSIPARHYDYSCEVYGFLPSSKENILSDKAGDPVLPYIEQLITMDAQSYIELCRASYDTYCSKNVNPLWLFQLKTKPCSEQERKKLCSFCSFLQIFQELKGNIKNLLFRNIDNSFLQRHK